jgi:DNA (cytosine-5)-methyltransferase 1
MQEVFLNFVSLYSGCGGLDLGFSLAGFKPVRAYDFWNPAVNTYKANFGNSIVNADISSESFTVGIKADLVLLGSPCQGFSTIGKRKLEDPRNQLLETGIRNALSANPKFIVCENVLGLGQGSHKSFLCAAISQLSDAGYSVQTVVGHADEAGAPQKRKRLFIVARFGKRDFEIEFREQQRVSLGEALAGVEQCIDHEPTILAQGSHDEEIAKQIRPGQKLSDVRVGANAVHTWNIPAAFGATTNRERTILEKIMLLRRQHRERDFGDADPVSVKLVKSEITELKVMELETLVSKGFLKKVGRKYDLKNGFNGKYRRSYIEGTSNTVDTKFGNPSYFLHPTQNRGFSVREAARIQTFPDDFHFSGSKADKFKMIGNAVPPLLGKQLALALRSLDA